MATMNHEVHRRRQVQGPLKTLDEVATTKTAVVITKRGRPVAKLVPYVAPSKKNSLAGSVLKEVGDPFGTGERWDADADAP